MKRKYHFDLRERYKQYQIKSSKSKFIFAHFVGSYFNDN
jgi:hypothetical protein